MSSGCLSKLVLFLTLLGGDANVRKFHLRFYGRVQRSEGSGVLERIPRVSKSTCAAKCVENAKCQALELCEDNGTTECSLTTGQLSPAGSNTTHPTCQLYRLENPCVEGFWNRDQNSCTQNLTSSLPPNTCTECHCLLGLLAVLLSAGETRYTLSSGKDVVCVITMTLTLYGPVLHEWTVIQRRRSTSGVSFDRDWDDYKEGFGSVNSDFWMGNEYIYQLTNVSGSRYLQIEIIISNFPVKVEYLFSIESEADGYRLHITNLNIGTSPGDPFSSSGCPECANLMKFATRDVDNDNDGSRNCADVSKGGWWHSACQKSNLNGQFGQSDYRQGINWIGSTNILSVEMRVRRP